MPRILFDMGATRDPRRRPAIAAAAICAVRFGKKLSLQCFSAFDDKRPEARTGARDATKRILSRTVNGYHRASSEARSRDVRRRNLIRHEEMPYDLASIHFINMVYDTGDLPASSSARWSASAMRSEGYLRRGQNSKAALSASASVLLRNQRQSPWEYARVEVDNAVRSSLLGWNSSARHRGRRWSQIVAMSCRFASTTFAWCMANRPSSLRQRQQR